MRGRVYATHRRPAGLANSEVRLVRELLRGSDVFLLEERVRPARRIVNRHVREPRVHVRKLLGMPRTVPVSQVKRIAARGTHSEVDVRQHLVVEVRAGVGRADGDAKAEVLDLGLHVGDVRVEKRRALIANRRVRVVAATMCTDVAKNHGP